LSAADLRNTLISLAGARPAYRFGVADLDVACADEPDLLQHVGDGFTRACVFAIPLQNAAVETVVDRPTPLYFHNYRQINYELDTLAMKAALVLQEAGHRALAIAASQIVSRDPMRGHVSHRVLAWAAGLGWWGRNNLLVNPDYGARVRLVSVLTDAPLVPDRPLERDCSTCFACVKVCPADAIAERREDFQLDRCYAKLCEFTKIPYVGQHICGVCVKACHPTNWPK